jgi:hypothetical protein
MSAEVTAMTSKLFISYFGLPSGKSAINSVQLRSEKVL